MTLSNYKCVGSKKNCLEKRKKS